MARPTKCRRVCHYPKTLSFSPDGKDGDDAVILTVDEYEAIRLIDRENLSQEECALQLTVARTTVQKIYETARKKLAAALVMGLSLKIEGGDYRLCGGEESCPNYDCCSKHCSINYNMQKGEKIMRIAVTYENGEVFQHFGHTEQFKVYDIDTENRTVVSSNILDTNGSGHGALAGFLQAIGVEALICGGIGGGARTALKQAGIELYGGVSGNADFAVNELLEGRLAFNPNVMCNHHGHEHSEGHTCGDHSCGNGSCGNH